MTPALAALASASADWSQEPSMISVAPSTTSVRISATQRAPRSCQIDFAIRFPVPLTCRTRLLSTRRVVMLRTCLRWRLLRSREGTLRRTGLLQGIPSSPLPFPFSSFGSMVRLVISVPGAQSSLDYGGRFFHLWLDLAPNVPLMPDEQCDGRKVRGRAQQLVEPVIGHHPKQDGGDDGCGEGLEHSACASIVPVGGRVRAG